MNPEEFREHVKTKINEGIACKATEKNEEECVGCGLSSAAGILLGYCEDEMMKDDLLNTFLEGNMSLKFLIDKIGKKNIPGDILEWFKQTVPFDKTLAEVED